MPTKAASTKRQKYIKLHADGSVWAKGSMINGVADGYFEWFRKDGSKLRSGYFRNGEQTGEWITYDAKGKPYKVTDLTGTKSKSKPSGADKKKR